MDWKEQEREKKRVAAKKFFRWGIAIIILVILFFGGWYTIPAGYRGVLLTFGKADVDAKGEGFHLKVPLIQKVVKMEVRTQKYQAELTAASRDLQDVKTVIAINYHLVPSDVPKIYTEIGEDYSDRVIFPMEQEANKAVTATFTAEELITKREIVRQKMKDVLEQRLTVRNIVFEDVSIVDFKFSDVFTQAIESKVTAEQNALKEENNLKVVQFQAQQKVAAAKGDAEAVQIVSQQLQQSPSYLQYYMLQKWNGIMPLSLGSSGLLLNIAQEQLTK